MSGMDRIVRIVIALVFGLLYFTNKVTGTMGIVLLVLGVVFILTSFISFCPLYTLFGISTTKKK